MSNTAEVINFPIKTELTGGRMADLSNGYTRIANEIQKLKPRLPGASGSVLRLLSGSPTDGTKNRIG